MDEIDVTILYSAGIDQNWRISCTLCGAVGVPQASLSVTEIIAREHRRAHILAAVMPEEDWAMDDVDLQQALEDDYAKLWPR